MIGGNQFLNPTDVIDISGLSEGSVVADLGCGSGGYFVIPFAHRVGATGKVYAVDILPEALKTVENAARSENLTNIETIWSNLEIPNATTIPTNSLDYAFLINVLFQNTKKETILQEAKRMLKAKGYMVVVDWRKDVLGFGPDPSLRIDTDWLEEAVKKMDFQHLQTADIGTYHFISVFKK